MVTETNWKVFLENHLYSIYSYTDIIYSQLLILILNPFSHTFFSQLIYSSQFLIYLSFKSIVIRSTFYEVSLSLLYILAHLNILFTVSTHSVCLSYCNLHDSLPLSNFSSFIFMWRQCNLLFWKEWDCTQKICSSSESQADGESVFLAGYIENIMWKYATKTPSSMTERLLISVWPWQFPHPYRPLHPTNFCQKTGNKRWSLHSSSYSHNLFFEQSGWVCCFFQFVSTVRLLIFNTISSN